MEKIEQVIEKQFIEFTTKFRPVFGNKDHIQIAKQLGEIKKMEKELVKRQEAAKDVNTLILDMARLKRQTLYLLKR